MKTKRNIKAARGRKRGGLGAIPVYFCGIIRLLYRTVIIGERALHISFWKGKRNYSYCSACGQEGRHHGV